VAGWEENLALRLGLAAPGGVLLGIVLAKLFRHIVPFVTGTLGGNLLEFVTSFGVWIIAERLGLSAVLCLVAFAMTIARSANLATRPRMRIHSFALWDTAVFLLNVLAFLLMGLQARSIAGDIAPDRLREAALFAAAVVLCRRALSARSTAATVEPLSRPGAPRRTEPNRFTRPAFHPRRPRQAHFGDNGEGGNQPI
jgi:monovalent cation/hydrogen antiporter